MRIAHVIEKKICFGFGFWNENKNAISNKQEKIDFQQNRFSRIIFHSKRDFH